MPKYTAYPAVASPDGTEVFAVTTSPGGSPVTKKMTTSQVAGLGSQPQATLSGTTAGSAISSQPFQGANFKKFIVYLSGYNNTTGGAQTITFPTAFLHTPVITVNSLPVCSVSTTQLTLPASMSGPITGWVIVEGF